MDSRITWEKMNLELELLAKEEPQSLLPLLIGINCLLRGDNFQDWCTRNINFMVYELNAACEGLDEDQRLQKLNEFFFNGRDYRLNQIQRVNLTDRDLFIRDVLSERSGGALPVAMIYIHLAYQLNLPMMIVNVNNLCLVRWMRSESCKYIDLAQRGEALCEDDLLHYLNREACIKQVEHEATKLDVLSFKQVMTVYLEDLRFALARSNEPDLIHSVLGMLLKIQPNNLKYLSERALLRRNLGFHKEALSDIKRYFSFCDMTNAPSDLQMAFKELTAFNHSEVPDVLH